MENNEKMVNPAVNSVPNMMDDGVCEGEYRRPYPTQEEIIAFNRKEYSSSIDGPGVPIERNDDIGKNTQWDQKVTNPNTQWDKEEMVLIEKDLLEKLKDFEYWKEWRNQQ